MNGSITFDGSLVGDISGGGGGGGDEVIITPVVTSGTKIADVSVNGVEKDLYCPTPPTPPEVEITPVVTSGTKIADVSIGGVEKDLYAPDYGADITALDGRLDTAEDNITSLTGRVGTAEGNITSLTGRMGTAEGNITGLTTRMGTAEGNITGLTNRMGAAEGNITNLSGRMTEAENDITALGIECDAITADLAAPYDEESTYSEGDYCTHNKVLYQCNTDISTAEEWDATHWDIVKVTDDITEIKSSLSNLGSWNTKPWTATSSTAINTQLTDKITLNKGRYVLIGSTPSCSTDQVFIELASSQTITIVTGIDLYTVTRSYNHFVFPFEVLTDNTDVWLKSSSSATVNFTQPSRGYIRAIRIA